jgi:hypothetical protein
MEKSMSLSGKGYVPLWKRVCPLTSNRPENPDFFAPRNQVSNQVYNQVINLINHDD